MERKFRKVGVFIFFLFSLSAFAFQKLTTSQMRENSIRINALEINELEIEIPRQMTIVLDDRALNFDFDKAIVKPEYYEILKNVAEFITIKDFEVVIVGHTDSLGSDKYNLALSQKRAEAVRDKLIEIGLEADRIVEIVGKGESEPITTNETEEGRFKNRRVEFKLEARKTR